MDADEYDHQFTFKSPKNRTPIKSPDTLPILCKSKHFSRPFFRLQFRFASNMDAARSRKSLKILICAKNVQRNQ